MRQYRKIKKFTNYYCLLHCPIRLQIQSFLICFQFGRVTQLGFQLGNWMMFPSITLVTFLYNTFISLDFIEHALVKDVFRVTQLTNPAQLHVENQQRASKYNIHNTRYLT